MDNTIPKLMFVAGEASGDLLGGRLAQELKNTHPDIHMEGLGGPKMQAAGVSLYQDFTQMAVMGFVEVIKNYSSFRQVFDDFLSKADELKPDAVILIDYPGFNLRLAKQLKKRNIKVIYYVSPQVWAWKKNRIKQIEQYVDKLLVLFKFEEEFYKPYNVNARFVGHHLVETVKPSSSREEFFKKYHLQNDMMTIGLLPGSRRSEIEYIFPTMIEAALILKNKYPHTQFLIPRAQTLNEEYLKTFLPEEVPNFHIISDEIYNCIHACDICLVVSGTVTLEVGLLEKPMVIIYKTSAINYAIAKMVLKIKNISLVNIVSQKEICPELLQNNANPKKIFSTLEEIFTNEIRIVDMREDLRKLRPLLGDGNANKRAASEVLEVIEQ